MCAYAHTHTHIHLHTHHRQPDRKLRTRMNLCFSASLTSPSSLVFVFGVAEQPSHKVNTQDPQASGSEKIEAFVYQSRLLSFLS